MGFGEIVIIVIVALLFIGPEKLPQVAKTLSKGIRDVRKQTRELRETIDDDNEIGEAIRDLQSALRGDDIYAPPARHGRALAQKAGAPGPASESLAPGAETGAALAAGAGVATSAGAEGAADPPAEGRDGAEAVSVTEPVIAPPAGAIARGRAAEASAPAPDTAAGDAAEPAAERAGADASNQPASGHAHG